MRGLEERLERILGSPVRRLTPLHGGMVADARLVEFDGGAAVAKTARGVPLSLEARMLRYLAERGVLPVPQVLHADDDLLLLEHLPGHGSFDDSSERHCAELLAGLHRLTADSFGFAYDTLIGPLRQENAWEREWPTFYRERRLLPVLAECQRRKVLPEKLVDQVRAVSLDLDSRLPHAPTPSLLHGDVWSGNVLAQGGRVTGFLDPALYYGDREMELAFIDLFGTFGEPFWRRYQELWPVDDGYERGRRDVYQLYPLLVHVALFGGSYVATLSNRLQRLGYR